MDATPVTPLRRSRSKLSRRDRGLLSPDPMAVCASSAAADRHGSGDSAFSTPLRAPPTDSVCWESPVSPFSPPPLSQTCEVYWEDEQQRRTIEELRRSVSRPKRVPSLPAPLAASPAPLLPTNRRKPTRATRQQQQQLMALLERAETLCTQRNNPPTREPEPPPAEAAGEPPPTPPPAEAETESNELLEIESDPELDRSMLRCTQLAEQAAAAAPKADTPVRRVKSFNAFVMEAMPDDEDEIFSQIPVEALDGADKESGTAAAAAGDSSSGFSSASSAPPPRPAGRGMPRTVSAPDCRPVGEPGGGWSAGGRTGRVSSSQTAPRPAAVAAPVLQRIPEETPYRDQARSTTAAPGSSSVRQSTANGSVASRPAVGNSTAVMGNSSTAMKSVATRPAAAARPSAAPTSAAPTAVTVPRQPGGHPAAAAAATADPARQKAEMNRRRAEALRKLRQNQRARSVTAAGQTR